MTSRLTRILSLALVVFAALGIRASAGPITYNVIVNTAPANGVPTGTMGSLEFEFASNPPNGVGSARIYNFSGGSFPAGGMTTVFFGSASGSLQSGGLTIAETPPSIAPPTGTIADAAVDFNYGRSFSFTVTLSEPGQFSLLLWNAPGGNGSTPTPLTLPDFADSFGNGPALVLTVPDLSPVEASPGVTAQAVIPEPSSCLLLASALAGLGVYRRVRSRDRQYPSGT